jgi:hypothetical protein
MDLPARTAASRRIGFGQVQRIPYDSLDIRTHRAAPAGLSIMPSPRVAAVGRPQSPLRVAHRHGSYCRAVNPVRYGRAAATTICSPDLLGVASRRNGSNCRATT